MKDKPTGAFEEVTSENPFLKAGSTLSIVTVAIDSNLEERPPNAEMRGQNVQALALP